MDRLRDSELLSTTDASVWAKEFRAVWSERKVMDEGWLISWFANAIETGRSTGLRQSLSQESVREEALEDAARVADDAAEFLRAGRDVLEIPDVIQSRWSEATLIARAIRAKINAPGE